MTPQNYGVPRVLDRSPTGLPPVSHLIYPHAYRVSVVVPEQYQMGGAGSSGGVPHVIDTALLVELVHNLG
ncbi:hypothetical protein N7465_002286 [Penicillium sp. CMV-2018d]|nr:hypothetical protein N7465_002286 [Penicillium sp. CMV-2018d]